MSNGGHGDTERKDAAVEGTVRMLASIATRRERRSDADEEIFRSLESSEGNDLPPDRPQLFRTSLKKCDVWKCDDKRARDRMLWQT